MLYSLVTESKVDTTRVLKLVPEWSKSVLLPVLCSKLDLAVNSKNVLKIKACLFSICTSLVVRVWESLSHPLMHAIKRMIETVLLWPCLNADSVSKVQHGCIDCLALMICVELQAEESITDSMPDRIRAIGKKAAGDSVVTYVKEQWREDHAWLELSTDIATRGNLAANTAYVTDAIGYLLGLLIGLLIDSVCSFIPKVVLTAPLPLPVSSMRDTLPPMMVILTAPGVFLVLEVEKSRNLERSDITTKTENAWFVASRLFSPLRVDFRFDKVLLGCYSREAYKFLCSDPRTPPYYEDCINYAEVNILSIQFTLGIRYVCPYLCFALQVLAILCLCIKNAKIEAYKNAKIEHTRSENFVKDLASLEKSKAMISNLTMVPFVLLISSGETFVVEAKVWIHDGQIASLIYVIDCNTGTSIEDYQKINRLEARLRSVLQGDNDVRSATTSLSDVVIHPERRLHQMMFADRDYQKNHMFEFTSETPLVTVQNWEERGYSIVNVQCKDRSKLLFDVVCNLTDMEYVVFHATINTRIDQAYLEFYKIHKDGTPISSEPERQRLIQCLQAAVERRSCEGVRLELSTEDRQGLLAEVMRTFRENGLNVTRVDIATAGYLAANTFYVTDAIGYLLGFYKP
ncbi:hypothetical protein P8452_66546 [Trifolium repens]|nr:hypothetical protein P8452_66546 [Trifolium repens]WJX83922.1 hypothetical protein P8452_66546 [Trifolium repens]